VLSVIRKLLIKLTKNKKTKREGLYVRKGCRLKLFFCSLQSTIRVLTTIALLKNLNIRTAVITTSPRKTSPSKNVPNKRIELAPKKLLNAQYKKKTVW
jgi:hypothetical protein